MRLGLAVWGIVVGCILGIAAVIGMVATTGLDGGRDAGSWAWIDVVSHSISQLIFYGLLCYVD